jgi:2-enoate reductase
MKLLEKGKIGKVTLKNRVIMTPMGMFGVPNADGSLSERGMDFYLERARGGTALVFPAAALVTRKYESPVTALNAFDSLDKAIGWSRLAEKVHHHGAKLGIQLSAGLGRASVNYFFDPSYVPVSASPVPAHWTPWITCRPLEKEEIAELVGAFGMAAMMARGCGIDVIEIHGYGGYLLDQFMSSLWNTREDEYGGDLAARVRFPLEVLAAVTDAVAGEVPVIFKMTPVHHTEGGRKLDEGIEIAKMLERAGADAIHVDAGCYESWHRAIPPVYEPQAAQESLAAAVKSAVSIPVIANGKLGDPAVAERLLGEGKADFIGLGRPHLADPFWVSKVASGALEDIVPCIGCCEGCIARGFSGKYASCAVNPCCTMERDYSLEAAATPRRVLVIGGGPAGMTAAVTAARRGHEVTIWEREGRLGGCLVPASAPDFKRDVGAFLDHLVSQVDKLGIEVCLGKAALAAEIEEHGPDVLILASGAARPPEAFRSVGGVPVFDALDVLTGNMPEAGELLVAGAGVVGCETALYLAEAGKRVAVADPQGILMSEPVFMLNQASLLERMDAFGVRQIPGAEFSGVERGGAVLRTGAVEELFPCEAVVTARGFEPGGGETVEGLDDSLEVHVIGDAAMPGKVLDAVWQGFHTARLLD